MNARGMAALPLAIMTTLILLTLGWASAEAATHDVAAPMAQVSPYQLPDVTGLNGPTGFDFFTPFQNLPLWAQAAIVSALVTVGFFILAATVRWVWRVVSDAMSRTAG